ncbi:RNA polymerase II transcription mediators [Zea mays]|uniref:RNA polymerase II transcription mediators n=1 Tax=Zea mays TaxID=4577 RepID=A0A1D6NFA4_MAIZE|nr:RNA polymerase II transcription mediators [Zea mays]ONM39159.1 RNA polymerase II transcription mediators [Zea mays]
MGLAVIACLLLNQTILIDPKYPSFCLISPCYERL